jgi:hypothetical protein
MSIRQKEITLKNIREKLLKTNAAMWLNKMCGFNQLTPKYVHVEINANRCI